MSTKRRLSIVVVVMVVTCIVEVAMVLHGVVPLERMHIRVEAPLYPMKFVYAKCVVMSMGRGIYIIDIKPETRTQILVEWYSNGEIHTLNETLLNEKILEIYSEAPPTLCVFAYAKPYQTKLVDIEVVRR